MRCSRNDVVLLPIPFAKLRETQTIKSRLRVGQSAYEAWAGGAAFGDDNNGLAFLLGAANPSESLEKEIRD